MGRYRSRASSTYLLHLGLVLCWVIFGEILGCHCVFPGACITLEESFGSQDLQLNTVGSDCLVHDRCSRVWGMWEGRLTYANPNWVGSRLAVKFPIPQFHALSNNNDYMCNESNNLNYS
jgi:hypothetical protein